MKMGRRILSCMLAFAMMLSCVGINAYAVATDNLTTDNFSLDISQVDNTLTVALVCDKSVTGWGAGGGKMSVAGADGTEAGSYFTLTAVSSNIGDKNDSVQNAEWSSTANNTNGGDSLQAGTWATYTYTVSDSVPDGNYTFTMQFSDGDNYDGTDNMNDYSISGQSVTATYTIGSTEVTAPYTATLSSTTTTVDNNGTDTVSVNVVVGGTTKSFASTEIKLAYAADYLTFNADSSSCNLTATVPEGKTDQAASITATNGVITIRDYGGTMTVEETGTTAYTLVFNTVKGGNTSVSLTSAGFSTQGDAASQDLTYVSDADSEVNVTIKHKVTISEKDSTGDSTVGYVAPNGEYTFTIPGYNAGYTYTVSATIDGESVSEENIVDNGNGNYTVRNVTGALVITYEKTAISYTVTFDDKTGETTTVVSNVTGATLANSIYTVPYNTEVGFTVAAGLAPNGTADGYYYSVKAYLTSDPSQTITVGSAETDNYVSKTYTIAANVITGDITIEVTKVDVSASQTTITISGDYTELSKDGTALTSETLNVNKNDSVTLTLNKEDGYTYTVQTKVGDADAQDVNVGTDNSVTISVGDDALTLIITKTLNTTSLDVTEYVQLDGKTMWLVKINGLTETTGKTYTYKASEEATAENFFWSSKYNAYCYLIIADTSTSQDAVKTDVAGKIGLTGTAAVAINYNGNVNLTTNNGAAVIDVNDAQLVWNMYSAVYSEFTDNVTVQKFLEADMDFSGKLSTNDAVAVVAKIQ